MDDWFVMSNLVAVGVGIKIIALWPCGQGDDLTVRCGCPGGDDDEMIRVEMSSCQGGSVLRDLVISFIGGRRRSVALLAA